MNFQQLRYYVGICDAGSFTRASENLFISQQGLSMAISNLETEFSTKFLIRTQKGVTLTPEGEYFRDWARGILDSLQECFDHFDGNIVQQAIIKCAGAQGVLSEFAMSLISDFEKSHKGYTVHLREYRDRVCDAMLESDAVELCFSVEPVDTKRYECHRVFQSEFACLLPEGHPWTKYEKIPLHLLPMENLITVDEEFKSADWFIEACAERGVRIEPGSRCGEVTAVHRLVREGHGIGLTTRSVAESLETHNTTWRLFDDDSLVWAVDICKKKGVRISRQNKMFYDYVLSKL